MSLLLDALKKAADDKQKAEKDTASSETSVADAGIKAIGQKQAAQDKASDDTPEVIKKSPPAAAEELTLELDEFEPPGADNIESPAEIPPPAEITDSNETPVSPDSAENRYDVTDEALAMLIYKTNREARLSRRWLVLSAIAITVFIILSGGGYYYLLTQDEIINLERKHRIAMQAMKAKTSQEQSPDNAEIIRNLVSDADLQDKVEFARKHVAEKSRSEKNEKAGVVAAKRKLKKDKTVVSIRKTSKTDPIEEKLDKAWLAYDAGQYNEAKPLYQAVLQRENHNRDALLGLAAIALTENNINRARAYYQTLLQLDPHDSAVIAALSGLHYGDTSSALHEEYLLSMLEKNPEAAPLSFALGNVYAQQKKWKSAQQAYFNAWQHAPENANYLFNLAVSLDQLGKHDQAIRFYKSSLQKQTDKKISFSREAVKQRIKELSEL